MSNRGKNPEFLAKQFPPAKDVSGKMAKKPLSVKFPEELDAQIRSIPGYSEKVRQWVIEGMQRDRRLPDGSSHPIASSSEPPEGGEAIDLSPHIDAVLMSIKPSERRQSKALFKKLTDRLK